MALTSITYPAGQPMYLPKKAIIRAIDIPEDATVESDCFDLDGIPGFECYGVYFCQSINRDGPLDTGNTDDYEFLIYNGLIVNGIKYPFGTPVPWNTKEEGADMTAAIESIIEQMNNLPQAEQGLFLQITGCDDVIGGDGDSQAGICTAIALKTLPPYALDMRLYADVIVEGEADDVDTTSEIHFPFFSSADLLEIKGYSLCGCGA